MLIFPENIEQLLKLLDSHSKTFVLCDGNTINFCLPLFFEKTRISDFILIEIPFSERCKNLDTVQEIWKQLIENHADRKSLLINLGGGVVSDIGGFAASCYQRGIDFINVPTTLLSMVDAAVGGKTGVDFHGLKNQIGTFAQPLAVVVMTDFLCTLPKRELQSGLGEILKYGFISNASLLDINVPIDAKVLENALRCKLDVVEKDPKENGLRKCLNFGHTIGHAIESFLMRSNSEVLHGEAVALGILPALYLSEKYCGLDEKWTHLYEKIFASHFASLRINDLNSHALVELMRHDKKNLGDEIRFVLISEPGKPVVDVAVKEEDIIDSINYLLDYLKDESRFAK